MYCGRDFAPSDGGINELYTFDLAHDLRSGDAIASAVWSCAVSKISEAPDPDAASCLTGISYMSGTKTSHRFTGFKNGVTYVLTALVTTQLGDKVSLWSHVECRRNHRSSPQSTFKRYRRCARNEPLRRAV